MRFICTNGCAHEQTDDDICSMCDERMERGALCIHCQTARATHDDECLHYLAVCVIDRVTTIESLPAEWRAEVSDEVAAEVAYRERKRLEHAQKARDEFNAMLAMVAKQDCGVIEIPDYAPGFLTRRQAGAV